MTMKLSSMIGALGALLVCASASAQVPSETKPAKAALTQSAVVTAPASSRPTAPDQAGRRRLARRLHALRPESGDIAGAVVVVVKDGQVLTERGFGYRRRQDAKAGRSRAHAVPPRLGLEAVHLDGGDAAGPGGQDRTSTPTSTPTSTSRFRPDDGKPITLRNLMTHTPGFAETAKYLIHRRAEAAAAARQDADALGARRGSMRPARCRPIRTMARRWPATSSSASPASHSTPMSSGISSRRWAWRTPPSTSRCRRPSRR